MPAGRALDPADKASNPVGRVLELAGRTSVPAGRALYPARRHSGVGADRWRKIPYVPEVIVPYGAAVQNERRRIRR